MDDHVRARRAGVGLEELGGASGAGEQQEGQGAQVHEDVPVTLPCCMVQPDDQGDLAPRPGADAGVGGIEDGEGGEAPVARGGSTIVEGVRGPG